MNPKYMLVSCFAALCLWANAQYSVKNAHSHNDYANTVPFWTAYNAHFGSIEADIFAVEGELYVAHLRREITPTRTLDALYIDPLIKCFKNNGNRPWPGSDEKLQLVIDLKTPPSPTLDLLIDKLAKYPEIFDRSVNPHAVLVVVSGSAPPPADFGKYPAFILFDGRVSTAYSAAQLDRIAMFSAAWSMPKGKPLTDADRKKVEEMVGTAHRLGRKMRFWATEDTAEGWKLMMDLHIDLINTDKINDLAAFLKNDNQ